MHPLMSIRIIALETSDTDIESIALEVYDSHNNKAFRLWHNMHIKLNLTNISNFMLPNFTITFEGFNLA